MRHQSIQERMEQALRRMSPEELREAHRELQRLQGIQRAQIILLVGTWIGLPALAILFS